MTVTIRKRELKGEDRFALYLDLYSEGKQWQENLKLYLECEKGNPIVKQMNKQTMELATRVRAERLLDLQNHTFGFQTFKKSTITFNEFAKKYVEQKEKNGINIHVWDSVLKQLNNYRPNTSFSNLTESYLEEFKKYLLAKLKQNSVCSYFSKTKAIIHEAYRQKLIRDNPADRVKSPKEVDTHREYLTADEVQLLVVTYCRKDVLKRAFLFSCLTGLRWSDVHKLTWADIRNEEGKYYLHYTQKKTRNAERLPISLSAYKLLGDIKDEEQRPFEGLQYSGCINGVLRKWATTAGIKKRVSFHSARHTNAVLLLNNGVDIFTVSKMLGHREIKTTQIYSEVLYGTKLEAISKLPEFSL